MDEPEDDCMESYILRCHLALLDGILPDAEIARFSELLETSAEARQIFVEHRETAALLMWMYRRQADQAED
jgi:hypothetical protein